MHSVKRIHRMKVERVNPACTTILKLYVQLTALSSFINYFISIYCILYNVYSFSFVFYIPRTLYFIHCTLYIYSINRKEEVSSLSFSFFSFSAFLLSSLSLSFRFPCYSRCRCHPRKWSSTLCVSLSVSYFTCRLAQNGCRM